VTFGSDRLRLALLVLAVSFAPASANPADDAFTRGRELFKAGKFAEACTAFEESQRLDPSFGTRFNIAQCSERTGKLATAFEIYRDLAAHDTNATRKAAAGDLAAALEARVPRLRLSIEPRPADVKITIDGLPCARCAEDTIPLDAGVHVVVAHASTYRAATATVTASEGNTTAVALRLESATDVPRSEPAHAIDEREVDSPRSRSWRKRVGTYTIMGGGVLLGTAAVFGVLARSKWETAKDVCGGSTTCVSSDDTSRASELGDIARTRANISSTLFIAGGVIAATGLVFYLTSPDDSAIRVVGHPAGVTFAGRF
jgi:hypothetical protein